MKTNRIKGLALLAAVLLVPSLQAEAGKKPKEVYVPMDYSTCGYRASEVALPNVPNAVYVKPQDGDCSARLQRALRYVSSLKADKNGHRGAVLLGEGTYYIDQPLRIAASGVVIRGMGRGKTVIVKRGVDRGALIYMEGVNRTVSGDTLQMASQKVMAGSVELPLASVAGLKPGSRITVLRPSTNEWIASLGCDDFGGGLDYTGWKATDIDIKWHRTVTAVKGNTVTIDAPVTTTLDPQWGQALVVAEHNEGLLTECGVENLTLMSDHNDWNPKDEDHCWDAITMDWAADCWVRRVDFRHFAGSAVNLQLNTQRITVEDCIAQEPVSEIGGWRRGVFITRGEQTLVQRCVSRQGIHDFAAGYCAAGPNAFVQCEGEESLGFSGSIGSWAAGLLFDIVNIDGHDICFKNLEQFQMGTGWNTANSMLWQCTASTIWAYSPDVDNRCSGHGCWGTLTGNAHWTSSNDHVQPRSLFYKQLADRLGSKAINGYVLPRSTGATSSPTVEAAMKMAQQTLTEPRLTMEMWIDSVPYTASVSRDKLKDIDDVNFREPRLMPMPPAPVFAVTDGHITANGALVHGNRYNIPWWNGRVKDNFTRKGARPAITRFVPGREGLGWTDRLDSVVSYMQQNGYCMLDHHYGLWYDLRRIDHERVRRADGDVSAPFYELPFSRTGKGTAWDGLSLYDLTKYNQWYWKRLSDFAGKTARRGMLLFHQNYFQHNIIEAGAHWVDFPWRAANNVNGTSFPEPVPFTGDKRIFMAEQFYNENDPAQRELHKKYIRQCLDNFKNHTNVVQLISEEYTGPLHFTRFWLETIAEWEAETGLHPMIALSCTKDVQDAVLADPKLAEVVDIIDIRYWHYNTKGLWAPEGGKNLAPRQHMRKMKVGKTGFREAYKAVREYRDRYPGKAVTFYAQQYPQYGWAILMAGGSCPNIPVTDHKFLTDVTKMTAITVKGSDDNVKAMGNDGVGYVIYRLADGAFTLPVATGNYRLKAINQDTGEVETIEKSLKNLSHVNNAMLEGHTVVWLEKL